MVEYVAFSVRVFHLPVEQYPGFERRLYEVVKAMHPDRLLEGDVEVEITEHTSLPEGYCDAFRLGERAPCGHEVVRPPDRPDSGS